MAPALHGHEHMAAGTVMVRPPFVCTALYIFSSLLCITLHTALTHCSGYAKALHPRQQKGDTSEGVLLAFQRKHKQQYQKISQKKRKQLLTIQNKKQQEISGPNG